ncbi:MAG: molybdenum ABC transporter ATP-binding protein [Alphaproteobacteria bacterium]
MLEIDVEASLGAFRLAARFASDARVTALFGPSGAGKSTLVNLIAGLTRPGRGRIVVDGRVLFDSPRGINLPPHRRRVGVVFQDGLLFPHLTARQNLLYGRRFAPRSDREIRFDQIVALLGIEHALERRPASLSGGEKQRVALGRALLSSPSVLLMDEPLASLDAERKAEILPYIERLRDELALPMVYVSHSLEEVARLADTLVLMADGTVTAAGPLDELLGRLDLAALAVGYEPGTVLSTRVAAHDTDFDITRLAFAGGELRVPRLEVPVGSNIRVRIASRDVVIATAPPTGLSIRNVLRGTLAEVRPAGGALVELTLDIGGVSLAASVTRHAVDDLGLAPGREVYALIKSVALDRRSLGPATRAASPPDPGS